METYNDGTRTMYTVYCRDTFKAKWTGSYLNSKDYQWSQRYVYMSRKEAERAANSLNRGVRPNEPDARSWMPIKEQNFYVKQIQAITSKRL